MPGGYTLLSPSLHSQCGLTVLQTGIARVQLPKVCDRYSKVTTLGRLQWTVPNRHRRKEPAHQSTPMALQHRVRPVSSYYFHHPQHIPIYQNITICRSNMLCIGDRKSPTIKALSILSIFAKLYIFKKGVKIKGTSKTRIKPCIK